MFFHPLLALFLDPLSLVSQKADERSYSFWTLSSYWSFIDAHARTIFDDMIGSNFEHSVDCPESHRISTRCDVPLAILGHNPLFY